MQPHEILGTLSPETVSQMFRFLQKEQKTTFRTCLATLASQRKLRPVFIERKPPDARYAWMWKECKRAGNEAIAANLLHIWLSNAQKPLLIHFLDQLGISHDGDGGIDTLPPQPDPGTIREAVESLLNAFPHEIVAIYLHAFQSMENEGWPALGELLATDPRLHLGSADQPPTASQV